MKKIDRVIEILNKTCPEKRRDNLLTHMRELNKTEISCNDCEGICCTFVANSMKVTPLEAAEIVAYLLNEKIWTDEFELKLDHTIKHYRLQDDIPGDGKREFIRRSYTCPFFNGKKLGCTLKKEINPYGCLGFNPKNKKILSGENCSQQELILEKRDQLNFLIEEKLNEELKELLSLHWNKHYLPTALKEVKEKIQN